MATQESNPSNDQEKIYKEYNSALGMLELGKKSEAMVIFRRIQQLRGHYLSACAAIQIAECLDDIHDAKEKEAMYLDAFTRLSPYGSGINACHALALCIDFLLNVGRTKEALDHMDYMEWLEGGEMSDSTSNSDDPDNNSNVSA